MTTTVRDLVTKVQRIYDQVSGLQTSIGDAYTKYKETGKSNKSLQFDSQIRDLKDEESKLDQEFREQEQLLQITGGKTRHQTLQEFVLLFFFTALALLGISLAVFSYVTTQKAINSVKIIGLITFIGLLVSAIIIRYA